MLTHHADATADEGCYTVRLTFPQTTSESDQAGTILVTSDGTYYNCACNGPCRTDCESIDIARFTVGQTTLQSLTEFANAA